MNDPGPAVREIFSKMPAHLNRQAAQGMDAVFQYNLTGEGAASYYTHIKDGGIVVTGGVHPAPAVTVTMTAVDFVDLIYGRLGGVKAFMTGRLKATGNLSLASKLQKLFQRSA